MDPFYLASLLVHTILTFGFRISAWSVSPKIIKLLKKKKALELQPSLDFPSHQIFHRLRHPTKSVVKLSRIDHGHFRIDSTYAAIITTGNVHLRLGFLRKIVWYGPALTRLHQCAYIPCITSENAIVFSFSHSYLLPTYQDAGLI